MTSAIAARLAGCVAAGAIAASLLLAAAVAPAQAQGAKPWRHGIIAPKSDAGFLLMAARGGFAEREGLKLELLEVKDDQIGLKALLAGELESYEGGVQGTIAADVRGADVKIIGCHWPLVPHGLMVKVRHRHHPGAQGQSHRGILARLVSRHVRARRAGAFQPVPVRCASGGGRRRSRPLHRAGRRRGRRGGGVERVSAAADVEEFQDAAVGERCRPEFPAGLHVLDRQGAGGAARGRDPLSHGAVQGLALCALAPRGDAQAQPGSERHQGRRSASRPSCSTMRSRPARSRPICRSRWRSSPGCRSSWSSSARFPRPAISPPWWIPESGRKRCSASASRIRCADSGREETMERDMGQKVDAASRAGLPGSSRAR